MVTKTLTYKDFNGVERTETFYFNLTAAELATWQNSMEGGMADYMQKIVAANNVREMIRLFQEILDHAYGRKSADGRRFEKSPEILADFKATQAYSDLYVQLATNAQAAADFVNALIPANLLDAQAAAAPAAAQPVLMPLA